MIENMFVGRPPGNYDRLLDFSRAVTGTLFFVPSASFPGIRQRRRCRCSDARRNVVVEPAPSTVSNGSLSIGSLKGENRHE
jgi:Predicted iron-dependent peroxidase